MLSLTLFITLVCACFGQEELAPKPQQSHIEISAPSNYTYSIHIPSQVRPGFDVVATVAIIQAPNPVNVSLNFTSADKVIFFSHTEIVPNSASTKIILGKIPISYQGSKKFKLTVLGVDHITNVALFMDSTTNFVLEKKSLSMLIQTDKAIYKPGQTMLFRSLCMKPDLRPLSGVVKYQVKDPKGNVVYLKQDVVLTKGVAEGKLNLSRHAMEGEWTIICNYKGQQEMITVTVQSYKLPKFEVKVSGPKVIYRESPGFTVFVTSNYTFGQAVLGSLKVKIERKTSYGSKLFPPRILIKDFRKFEGKMEIFITSEEMMNSVGWEQYSDQKLEVVAFVTETLTSTTFNDTTEIETKNEKIKIEILSKPVVAKPGLKYQCLVKVSEQDDMLLMESDRVRNDLIVVVTYNYRRYNPMLSRPIMMVFPIPPNGLVSVDIDLRKDKYTTIQFRAYTNTTTSGSSAYRNQWTASRALSPSDSFIQITTTGSASLGEVTVGTNAPVIISNTEHATKIRVMVISRGVIIYDTMIVRNQLETKQSTYTFLVTSEMTPSVLVLASYVRDDKEIVADSLRLNVVLALQNQMSIMTSEDSVDAGSNLNIQVMTSSPQSYVGLRAIDESVLLLKSGNDITKDRVESDLEKYSEMDRPFSTPFYRYSHVSTARVAEEVFELAKINILTNAVLYKYPQNQDNGCYRGRTFSSVSRVSGESEDSVAFSSSTSGRIVGGAAKSSSSSPRVRKLFPETWLWTSGDTKNGRSVSFNLTAPDTITSYRISAFSMSESQGLGIATPQELTVFRKFFVSLNLPLKITRGEIIIVQAIVFNYYEQDLTANLLLHLNQLEGVELLYPGTGSLVGAQNLRHINVPAGSAVSVKYPLRVSKLGEIPIRVTATSSLAVDSVVRNIFVKPEGIPQCYSSSVFIDKPANQMEDTVGQLTLSVPSGVIEGSTKASLHTYGDILGSTMSNLGHLLRIPSGCGEQNMLSFAPDIFVTLYLERIGRLDEETRKTALSHIVDGYMNQLRYKRFDGSFSAFGERDSSGSTWLTAFVVKCFNFARELQPELIEKSVIDQAVNFLISQQSREGYFEEPGRVINQAMQGGVNNRITMTAYVLIAMTETDQIKSETRVRFVVDRATRYLKDRVAQIQDPYTLALVSYALNLVEDSAEETELAFGNLSNLRTSEGALRWTSPNIGASIYSWNWAPPYTPALSYQIEAVSYMLLALKTKKIGINQMLPSLTWLVSKQNELGGYSSTQDTVMAIHALYEVSSAIPSRPQNLTLTITHSSDSDFERQLLIVEETSFVHNTTELTPTNGTISVSAQGSGIGIAQLSVCYNIPTSPYEQEPFRCKLDVRHSTNDMAMLEFCCALREDNMEPTGMFLFEIGLLNGFTVDVLDEERRNPMAKLIELEDDKVNVYYDQLLPREELCSSLTLLRIAEVASIKSAHVKAFEYYKPAKVVVRQYNVSELSNSDVCDVCGYECVGCPAPMLSDWKPWTPCVEFCKKENVTREKECVDPSFNKKIDMSRCGLEDVPLEIQPCNKTFSCPDSSDGLWLAMPRSHMSFEQRLCRVSGERRSPWTVIPGSTLNGHNHYIRCDINVLNTPRLATVSSLVREPELIQQLGVLLNNAYGFTISLLVKPHFYRSTGSVTFLSVGENGELPVIVMEKPINRDMIRLAISIDKKRDFVENISLSDIPVENWSHIMIVWKELTGAKVMVNGMEVGQSSSIRVEGSRKITKIIEFSLGRKAIGDLPSQGHFSGSFSALKFWSSALSESEVQGLSEYYQEILTYTGTEPLLSVRHLRDLIPPAQKFCFNKPMYLSHIYAEQMCG